MISGPNFAARREPEVEHVDSLLVRPVLLRDARKLNLCRLDNAMPPHSPLQGYRNAERGPRGGVQPIAIVRGWAALALGRVRVSTPSSRSALILSWSTLFDSANDRA